MVYSLEPLPSAPPAKSPTTRSDERGFTLVEVIVAMLVCVVGLVGLAQMLAVTLRMQQLGRNSTSAVRLAQDKIDELSSVPFGQPSVACGGSLATNMTNYNDSVAAAAGSVTGYTRRWQIVAGPDGDLNIRQVTVRLIPIRADRRVETQYDLVGFIRGAGGAC